MFWFIKYHDQILMYKIYILTNKKVMDNNHYYLVFSGDHNCPLANILDFIDEESNIYSVDIQLVTSWHIHCKVIYSD